MKIKDRKNANFEQKKENSSCLFQLKRPSSEENLLYENDTVIYNAEKRKTKIEKYTKKNQS